MQSCKSKCEPELAVVGFTRSGYCRSVGAGMATLGKMAWKTGCTEMTRCLMKPSLKQMAASTAVVLVKLAGA